MSNADPTQTDDEQLTETAKTRWEWLSTLTAATLIGTFILVMGALIWEPVPATWPGGIPGWVFLAGVVAAITYAIGEDVTEIIGNLRGDQ